MNVMRLLTHRATAYFQAILSITFIIGYFYVLMMFLSGHVRVPGEYHDMVIALIGVLTGSLATILQFWFARQRTSVDPIPQAHTP
jgi:Zn-dependent protease with chaperone function